MCVCVCVCVSCIVVGGKVKGGRRLQLLNESIDDDDNTSQPTIISESNRHLTHHNHILSSSIESDNTGEKTAKRESDEREEGEERGRASKRGREMIQCICGLYIRVCMLC